MSLSRSPSLVQSEPVRYQSPDTSRFNLSQAREQWTFSDLEQWRLKPKIKEQLQSFFKDWDIVNPQDREFVSRLKYLILHSSEDTIAERARSYIGQFVRALDAHRKNGNKKTAEELSGARQNMESYQRGYFKPDTGYRTPLQRAPNQG